MFAMSVKRLLLKGKWRPANPNAMSSGGARVRGLPVTFPSWLQLFRVPLEPNTTKTLLHSESTLTATGVMCQCLLKNKGLAQD